jgi:hypothetical protein
LERWYGGGAAETKALDPDSPEHQNVLCQAFIGEGLPQNYKDLYRLIRKAEQFYQNEREPLGQQVYPRAIENYLIARFDIPGGQILQWADEIANDSELLDQLRPDTRGNLREYVKMRYGNHLESLRPLLVRAGKPKERHDFADILASDTVYWGPIPVKTVETVLRVLWGIPIDTLRQWEREILGDSTILPQYWADPNNPPEGRPSQRYYGPLDEIDRFIRTGRWD